MKPNPLEVPSSVRAIFGTDINVPKALNVSYSVFSSTMVSRFLTCSSAPISAVLCLSAEAYQIVSRIAFQLIAETYLVYSDRLSI